MKKSISLFEIGKKKTPAVKRTDLDLTFLKQLKMIKKEDLGIEESSLVLSGLEFPSNPQNGQLFRRNGILYKYEE